MSTVIPKIRGEVSAPADSGWDTARQAWNLAVDQRPALVAEPLDAADVAAVVDYARNNGLRVAAQGTGHNANAIRSLDDTVLLSTRRMRGVEIDAEARIARVQAGTLAAEVCEAATEVGLFLLTGSSPDVGVVGYTLGGGLSWLGRKYGLAANHVTAIEVVTPDGAAPAEPPRPSIQTCSGRCGAAEEASEWLPRWSSGCFPTRSSTPACFCGHSSVTPRCSLRGTA